MDQVMEREVFSFSENSKEIVNSTKPFSSGHDCQFLLCCRETIYVFTITCDLDVRSHAFSHNLPCKLFTQQIIDLSAIPPFHITKGVINVSRTLKKISPRERTDFLVDSSLYPHRLFPKADLGGFRQAVFSPHCSSSHERFIAAVTFDHRVFLLEELSGQWELCCEFTSVLGGHATSSIDIPITVQAAGMPLSEYRDLVHSMSCVEIMWSTPFQCLDSDRTSCEILLLFCGMRSGHIHIWKLKTCRATAPLQDSFTFLATDKYASEVTALCWNPVASNCGQLSVGYMDGSLRVLSVHPSSSASMQFEITTQFQRLTKDYLSVFDLATTEINPAVHILVACRQYFIDIYRIHENNQTKFVKSIHIESSLPLESISLRGKLGSASSQDGTVFHFVFNLKCDDINVQCTKSKVACLPNATETIWSCKGTVLSLNGALCFSLYRPYTDFSFKGQAHSRFLDRQKLIMSFTPSFLDDNFILPTKSSSPTLYVSTLDITVRLLLVLQDIFRKNQSLEMIEELLDKLIVSERLENLQIARVIYLFEFYKIQKSTFLQSQALNLSSDIKSKELGVRVLCRHISNMLHSMWDNKDSILCTLPFISRWINGMENRRTVLSEFMGIDEISKITHVESAEYSCCLCDAELTTFSELLEVKCVNQHMNQLCCLTLSPIKGLNPRHCLSCTAGALEICEIAKMCVPFIKNIHQCTLCGGRLQ